MPSESFDLDSASVEQATEEPAVSTTETAPESTVDTEAGTVAAEATQSTEEQEYAPTWVDELDGLMANPNQQVVPQQGHIPEQEYYQPPPQQYDYNQQYYDPYQGQPQGPQQGQSDLDYLLQNPQEYIANVASQATAGQAQYIQQMESQVNRLVAEQANRAWNSARGSLDKAYKNVLNKDNTFKGNPEVRGQVEGLLKRAMYQVKQRIAQGDFNAGAALENPAFFPALLFTAKYQAGVAPTSSQPMQPAGSTMESVSPPVAQGDGVQLDPDLQSVANALGSNYEKELRAAVAEAEKRGDMMW